MFESICTPYWPIFAYQHFKSSRNKHIAYKGFIVVNSSRHKSSRNGFLSIQERCFILLGRNTSTGHNGLLHYMIVQSLLILLHYLLVRRRNEESHSYFPNLPPICKKVATNGNGFDNMAVNITSV